MSIKWIPENVIQHYLINPKNQDKISINETFNVDCVVSLNLDIGCGNGHFLVDIAKENPDRFYIGIEIKFERVCKTISKLSKRNIENVRMYHGDALNFINKNLGDNIIDNVYYNFPDPWPKRRHHKKRLFNAEFLNILCRILKHNGVFTCATDHKEYLEWMLGFIEKDEKFEHVFAEKISNNIPGYHSTLFEEKWREMGKKIYYFRIIKK